MNSQSQHAQVFSIKFVGNNSVGYPVCLRPGYRIVPSPLVGTSANLARHQHFPPLKGTTLSPL